LHHISASDAMADRSTRTGAECGALRRSAMFIK